MSRAIKTEIFENKYYVSDERRYCDNGCFEIYFYRNVALGHNGEV